MTSNFASESVTCGHPDKDQTADRILDGQLRQDPEARCACEVTCAPPLAELLG